MTAKRSRQHIINYICRRWRLIFRWILFYGFFCVAFIWVVARCSFYAPLVQHNIVWFENRDMWSKRFKSFNYLNYYYYRMSRATRPFIMNEYCRLLNFWLIIYAKQSDDDDYYYIFNSRILQDRWCNTVHSIWLEFNFVDFNFFFLLPNWTTFLAFLLLDGFQSGVYMGKINDMIKPFSIVYAFYSFLPIFILSLH